MHSTHGVWPLFFERGNWGSSTPRAVASRSRVIARRTTVEITEVRIKLMEEPGERLKAFCSITFDNCFVVRDLKIIDGSNGPFVAMPSRKLTSHCPGCGMKNHLRAQYCNQCGKRLTRRPRTERRRRPREAVCRHRASDQFGLPRDDSGCRDRASTTKRSSGRSSRVMFRATTISISSTAMRRAVGRRDSISRMRTRRSSRIRSSHAKGPARRRTVRGKPHYRRDSAGDASRAHRTRHHRRSAIRLAPESFPSDRSRHS